ncbi:hypothetical protein BDY21DRAFT_354732 [Lineolata rhizophorae]|uniref:Uncharacterized protein n=1 Tax=Lineolata rhizophorae TaxID=578093 RepID=A0A6A6NQD0_9PEZI|nr:hypothetical protein BDY21DRAFT_354732 [Lineolata rhizophorae]
MARPASRPVSVCLFCRRALANVRAVVGSRALSTTTSDKTLSLNEQGQLPLPHRSRPVQQEARSRQQEQLPWEPKIHHRRAPWKPSASNDESAYPLGEEMHVLFSFVDQPPLRRRLQRQINLHSPVDDLRDGLIPPHLRNSSAESNPSLNEKCDRSDTDILESNTLSPKITLTARLRKTAVRLLRAGPKEGDKAEIVPDPATRRDQIKRLARILEKEALVDILCGQLDSALKPTSILRVLTTALANTQATAALNYDHASQSLMRVTTALGFPRVSRSLSRALEPQEGRPAGQWLAVINVLLSRPEIPRDARSVLIRQGWSYAVSDGNTSACLRFLRKMDSMSFSPPDGTRVNGKDTLTGLVFAMFNRIITAFQEGTLTDESARAILLDSRLLANRSAGRLASHSLMKLIPRNNQTSDCYPLWITSLGLINAPNLLVDEWASYQTIRANKTAGNSHSSSLGQRMKKVDAAFVQSFSQCLLKAMAPGPPEHGARDTEYSEVLTEAIWGRVKDEDVREMVAKQLWTWIEERMELVERTLGVKWVGRADAENGGYHEWIEKVDDPGDS